MVFKVHPVNTYLSDKVEYKKGGHSSILRCRYEKARRNTIISTSLLHHGFGFVVTHYVGTEFKE